MDTLVSCILIYRILGHFSIQDSGYYGYFSILYILIYRILVLFNIRYTVDRQIRRCLCLSSMSWSRSSSPSPTHPMPLLHCIEGWAEQGDHRGFFISIERHVQSKGTCNRENGTETSSMQCKASLKSFINQAHMCSDPQAGGSCR